MQKGRDNLRNCALNEVFENICDKIKHNYMQEENKKVTHLEKSNF